MTPISVPNIDLSMVKATPAIAEEVQSVAAACSLVLRVCTERTQMAAVREVRRAKEILRRIEDSRETVKRPVLDLGRAIDQVASSLTMGLKSEVARLEKALSEYQRELQRQAAEERRRQEEEKRKAEAEALRIKREAEAKAAAIEDPTKAQQVLDLAAGQAKVVVAASEVAKPKPSKPAGLTVAPRWRFEVTDIWQVAQANRCFVRIEANVSAIQTAIGEGLRELPGLRIFEQTDVRVR